MAKLYNLARMTTATTGTGTMTLGTAVSGFLSFVNAGVQDGDVIAYGIRDGASSEIGTGTYSSSGTTLTRSVTNSTNANSPINLSGSAQVLITPRAADIGSFGRVVVQKFTSSGTYTPTAGMIYATIECVGGGGGGAGAQGNSAGCFTGGGGGGGGYSRKSVTAADIGASKAVTIGAAGSGGSSGGNGTAGGTTSVGVLCVAVGGGAGTAGNAGAFGTAGAGAAGSSGAGDVTASGATGGAGFYSSDGNNYFGASSGGSSIFGGGAPCTSTSNLAHGVAATQYGGGGSGGITGPGAGGSVVNGGNGFAGVVIVTEFLGP